LRSGCLSLVVSIGALCAAVVLGALSTALILSFGVSALGQPDGPERIFKVIIAVAAGFAFFLVGRGVWRDLRRRSSKSEERPGERGR
jgi:Kef-type K+ transport system membrane component KefB